MMRNPQMLRDYQIRAVEALKRSWLMNERPLAFMATGGGKTTVMAELLRRTLNPQSERALVFVHRAEIVQQIYERIHNQFAELEDFYYLHGGFAQGIGIVLADQSAENSRIIVASAQSLHPKRLERILTHGTFNKVIIDEAHHYAPGNSYHKILKRIREDNAAVNIAGFTATPKRHDKKSLGLEFSSIPFIWSILDGIKGGYLVPVQRVAVQTHVNVSGVKNVSGDYNQGQLCSVLETENWAELAVDAYHQYIQIEDRLTIAFFPSVVMSKKFVETAKGMNVPAAHLDGETPTDERRAILADFKAGKYRLLSNVGILTEGTDIPEVSAILMARPTRSEGLFCFDQMTEILTPDGWKKYNEVKVGDLVANYWPDTHVITWEAATDYVARPLYEGERMYAYASPSMDFRVTDRHRMLWRPKTFRRKTEAFQFILAKELAQRRSEFEIPVSGYQSAPGVLLSDDEIRFIGWFVTDGTLNRRTGSIQISQSSHQPQTVDLIKCLEGCGFKYRIYKNRWGSKFNETSERLIYHISKGKPRGEDTHLRGWGVLEKYIDKNLSPALDDLTSEQLGVFLEAVHLGDGAKTRGQSWTQRTYHIATGNLIFAERLQSLCVRRGFRCNLAKAFTNPDTGNTVYNLHIKREDFRHIGGIGYADRPHIKESPLSPDDIAWCVVVPSTALITRRNGKVLITGNTQIIGRGLRLHPESNKKDCLIVDLTVDDLKALDIGELLGKMEKCEKCKREYHKGLFACPHCGAVPEPKPKDEHREQGEGRGNLLYEDEGSGFSDQIVSVFSKLSAAWHRDDNNWMSCALGFHGGSFVIAPPTYASNAKRLLERLSDATHLLKQLTAANDKHLERLKLQINILEREYARIERWSLYYVSDKREVEFLQSDESLAKLIGTADIEALSRVPDKKQVRRDADWRMMFASINQQNKLKQLGVKFNPGTLTKGLASELMEHALSVPYVRGWIANDVLPERQTKITPKPEVLEARGITQ